MTTRLSISTPLGRLDAELSSDGLRALRFADGDSPPGLDGPDPFGVADALEAYFAGELGALDALPLATLGTEYERRVWRAVRAIPPGQTRSYGELAAALGGTSARAVGRANARNPVALVVPCHRVVGAGGALTGYAWGVERKRALLTHEGAGMPSLFGGAL